MYKTDTWYFIAIFMETVIICHGSHQSESRLCNIICRNLSKYYKITFAAPNKIQLYGKENLRTLLLLEISDDAILSPEEAVIVFDPKVKPQKTLELTASNICIVPSESEKLFHQLSRSRSHIITCGMSPKDTFCCSGKSENSASISLQREITHREKAIEPLETVLSYTENYSVYELLAYAAILTLLELPSQKDGDPYVIQ